MVDLLTTDVFNRNAKDESIGAISAADFPVDFLVNDLLNPSRKMPHFFLQSSPKKWILFSINFQCIYEIHTYRYLATGEILRSMAFHYRVSHSWISRITTKCLNSIVDRLLLEAIPPPTTETFDKNIRDFFSLWNFPNCCGAIDGKHVRIRCPNKAGSLYYNYKDFNSIVLLAIVDARYKFIAIDVGSYGREGDAGMFHFKKRTPGVLLKCFMLLIFSGIYQKSNFGQRIMNKDFGIPAPRNLPGTDELVPNVILGDAAFSLHENMMTPYSRKQSLADRTKAVYNYRHSRARRTTENAFGIWCARFRIFFTPINADAEKIDKIILAACILHNIIMRDGTNHLEEHLQLPKENIIPIHGSAGRPCNEGIITREKLKNYFNGEGAVPWQDRCINP